MEFAFFLSFAAIGIILFFALRQRQTIAKLKKTLQEKTGFVEKTSKLLIEKNLELNDQNVRLQQLLESKADFITIVSHQLRTPATQIKWEVEALLENTVRLSKEARERIENLNTSSQRMIHLIDVLLRMVRVENEYTQTILKPYNFDLVVKDVTKEIAARFKKKRIQLVLHLQFGEKPVSVALDSVNLVLHNLIENAFHYTPPGGSVIITSKLTKKEELFFSVQDTGIGIAPSDQATVFSKFKRGKAAMEMNTQGIGIGLYIAKNIIDRLEGIIQLKSKKGEGSTFFFTIPLHKNTPNYPAPIGVV